MSNFNYARAFGGVKELYGPLDKLKDSKIILFGVGGVGSWVSEALIRSGVGHLTLVDPDVVSISNLNRQSQALISNLGESKVKILAERLIDINPELSLDLVDDFVDARNIRDIVGKAEYRLWVDAIDNSSSKIAIAKTSIELNAKLIMSGAAGNRRDLRKIQCSPLTECGSDPLLKKVRQALENTDLSGNIDCIYSKENIKSKLPDPQSNGLNCGGLGSSMMITASFGLHIASRAVEILTKNV